MKRWKAGGNRSVDRVVAEPRPEPKGRIARLSAILDLYGASATMRVANLVYAPDKLRLKASESPRPVEARHYSPVLADQILVWLNPKDGKAYIVDGHARYLLAKRSGTEEVSVCFLAGANNFRDARVVGSLINICRGHGNALDVALLMREEGIEEPDLARLSVSSPHEGVMASGIAVAKLPPAIYRALLEVGRFAEATRGGLRLLNQYAKHAGPVQDAIKHGLERIEAGEDEGTVLADMTTAAINILGEE